MCARCEGRPFSEILVMRSSKRRDAKLQSAPSIARACAASTMDRPPILTAPIIASDTWFAEGSAVIDAKVTESSQEWT